MYVKWVNTIELLIKSAQKGNNKAFRKLVEHYDEKIFGLISRYAGHTELAKDIYQDVFFNVYKNLKSFTFQSDFYTWLYRIAINTAKNHLVSRSRRPPDTDIDIDEGEYLEASGALSDIKNPENSLATDQLEAVVYKAIGDLAEDLKVAVTLREFEGLTYEEIAEVMDCPVGTVRSRIFRAREAIEKKISAIDAN